MYILSGISETLKNIGIENEYIILTITSILSIFIVKIISKFMIKIFSHQQHQSKNVFKFSQITNLISNIVSVFVIFLIWEKHLSNVVTIISFISAGATIALREVILNLFAGIYIKTAHPFVIEDRIEVEDIKGDVVLITNLSFKVLEIGDRVNGDQSSGIIVNVPNSKVFSHSLKNYTAGFKYIWSEMKVNVPLDVDIDESKKTLYEIVNSNQVISDIPKKMNRAVDEASVNYRIYYNNLKPIIYTNYEDNHIEFCLRFLVHPKKERTVINDIWIKIIKEHQAGNFKLYIKE